MIYALDSNIVSYMLKDDADVVARYRQEIDRGNDFVIPPIVFFEVQRWLLAQKLIRKLARFDALCQKAKQCEVTKPVWQKAAQLYAMLSQEGMLVDDTDLLIASFCIINDFTLVTNNIRHFGRIGELKCINWK
ncbi:MAG: PIN domain-containing protein [Clostridia bacterium]|nr:PIN domain-containing protein [Clostridia bacterium]